MPAETNAPKAEELSNNANHAAAHQLASTDAHERQHAQTLTPKAEQALSLGLAPELLTRLISHYGPDATDAILDGYASKRLTTLRANTLKASSDEVARTLDAHNIAWQHPAFSTDAFVIENAREDALRTLEIYEQGGIYLQSLSAMLPALALDPHAGENILDMAAAPGGKTCQIAALASGKALITACEKNAVRAQKLRYNLEKQGVGRCNVMECDARKLDPFFTFDKVLLDAPCSGSGTLSLAEGSYQGGFSEELLQRSVKTQRALMRRALEAVRPGGIVVYATCSILPEENEHVVRYALEGAPVDSTPAKRKGKGRRHKPARNNDESLAPKLIETELVALPTLLLEGVPLAPCAIEGAATVMPTERYEGFFLAVIKRVR